MNFRKMKKKKNEKKKMKSYGYIVEKVVLVYLVVSSHEDLEESFEAYSEAYLTYLEFLGNFENFVSLEYFAYLECFAYSGCFAC